jgi:hypothetical protein
MLLGTATHRKRGYIVDNEPASVPELVLTQRENTTTGTAASKIDFL